QYFLLAATKPVAMPAQVVAILFIISVLVATSLTAASTKSTSGAAVAANKLSCNFDERHCCDFTMQGWRVASEGQMRLLCAVSDTKAGELTNEITVEGSSSLHLCLQIRYRIKTQRQQQQNPPLTLSINDQQVWSVDWPSSLGGQDSSSFNSSLSQASPSWQISHLSISLRPSSATNGRRRHTLSLRGFDGACLDALSADSSGRCPISRQTLLWLLLDQRVWLATSLCLMGLCLVVGLAASLLLSRRKGSGTRVQGRGGNGGDAVVGPRVRAQPVRLSQVLLSSPAPPLRRQSSQLHRQHPYQQQQQQQQPLQQQQNSNRLSVHLQHNRTPSNGSGNFPLPDTVAFRSARPISVPPGCTFLLGSSMTSSSTPAAATATVEPLAEGVESPVAEVSLTMASTLPRRPLPAVAADFTESNTAATNSSRPVSSTFVPAGVGGFGFVLGTGIRPVSSSTPGRSTNLEPGAGTTNSTINDTHTTDDANEGAG
ncbi:hypothetical protein BOX15_Mlig000679g1, partial [Macrostomum lignano]